MGFQVLFVKIVHMTSLTSLRSTLVSVLLREKDLKTSLRAVLLINSSSDAI